MQFRTAASCWCITWAVAGCATPVARGVCAEPREWKVRDLTPPPPPAEDPAERRVAEVAAALSIHTTGVTALGENTIVRAALDEFHEIANAGPRTDLGLLAEDVEFRVEDEYRRHGYPFADVTVAIGGPRPGRGRRVDVAADEGPRTIVTEVTVEGARAVPAAELARYYWDYAPRSVPVLGSHLYVERTADGAAQRIVERYRADGYPQARARLDRIAFNPDRTGAHLRYVVGEGPQATLASIQLVGRSLEHPEARVALEIPRHELLGVLRDAGITVGTPYSPLVGSRARDALLRHYAEEGYPFTVMQISETAKSDPDGRPHVALKLSVVENRYTRICRVGVVGNTWTQDFVVRRELDHLIGGVYQASLVDDAQRALTRLGIFRSVHVRRQIVDEKKHPDLVDLLVEVQESDWAVLRADAGFATNEGLRMAPTIDLPNFTSLGQSAQIRGILSDIRQRIEGKVTDPWALFLPIRARISGSLDDRPVPLSRRPAFRVREGQFEAIISRPILGPLEGLFGYRFTTTEIYDEEPGVNTASASATTPVDNLRASSLLLGWVLDGRDSRWNPREGAFASMTLTHTGRFNLDGTWEDTFGRAWRGSLGGNMHLGQLEGEIAAYASAGRFTLAMRGAASATVYRPTHAQVNQGRFAHVPPPYRVFTGGHRSVRSFGEGELGPLSGDDPTTLTNEGGAPLGGFGHGVVNAELRIRLWPGVDDSPFGIGAVFFADAGALWPYEDEALQAVRFTEGIAAGAPVPSDIRDRYRTRPTDLAFAVGFGIRIETIIGPIGFELGWNPDRRRLAPRGADGHPRHEDAFAFFFQVGQTF